MPRKDAVDADRNRVISEIRTQPGEWVHVTGVYDDTLSELRIYIGGKLEARDKTVFQEDVEADGDFAVARGTADESADRTLTSVRHWRGLSTLRLTMSGVRIANEARTSATTRNTPTMTAGITGARPSRISGRERVSTSSTVIVSGVRRSRRRPP